MKNTLFAVIFLSSNAMATTIEVHTPKGAKEAYAFEGASIYCKENKSFSFEQTLEINAMYSHYKEQRELAGLPLDYKLATRAARDVFKITLNPPPTWQKCIQALKK
ncbi:TPA: hypothetical protein SIA29_004253 [Aeromonas sobria]|nr:hypothetical protein [Aeromonas sobria]HEH9433324.1 hypothetical protein [Aeromonas sobria]